MLNFLIGGGHMAEAILAYGWSESPLGPPEIGDDIGPILDRALAGIATFLEDFRLTILRGDEPEDAWFTFSYSPIRDERGKIVGVLDTVVETTATVRAPQQSDLITRELLTGPVQALPAQGRN